MKGGSAEFHAIRSFRFDSPDLPHEVFSINGRVYMRMHDGTFWYNHVFRDEEKRIVK